MIATQFAWLNGMEIVGILIVVLILFGAKKLPELARGLGKGIQEFKKASRDVQDELHNAIESEPAPPPRAETRTPEKTVVVEKTGAEPEFAEQTVPQSQPTEPKA